MMDKRITPDHITELSKCEIFVFGSNLEGQHAGGAARFAYDHFGAEWGNGVGPQGRCYAIPTMHGPVSEIKPYVDDFIRYAKAHPLNRFLVTRVGCGIAGFKDSEIAPLFKAALVIPNISIPKEWFVELINYVDSVPNPEPEAPKVIDLKVLQRLCDEYRYVIGAGINWKKPSIQIRYVIDEDKFGNAWFGSFFFFGDTLYVWDRDEAWAPEHNADVVDAVFKDECSGRGYAHRVLYAGVRTRYKDSMGEFIYTGDVCHIKHHSREYDLPLSTLGSEENPDFFRYAFVLDNQCIYPEDCDSITRVGTVFFMLDRNDDGDLIDQLSRRFTDVMGQSPYSLTQRINMAHYTPSFYKDVWKYESMRVLEIEYNWRK